MGLSLIDFSLQVGKKMICSQLQFVLQRGAFCCILGKNGAGKTSFLHALCNVKKCLSGNVMLDDNDLLTASEQFRSTHIGLLPQHHEFFFPATVADIVLLGRYPYRSPLMGETATDYHVLADILVQLDLTALAKRTIGDLSGGEQQRAAIGMLLAQTPTVYLLDEPCNHLDIHYQIKVLDLFKQLTRLKKAIVIMVTHDINLAAKYADQIMLFFDEGVVLTGNKADLLQCEQLSKLYHHPIKQCTDGENRYFFS